MGRTHSSHAADVARPGKTGASSLISEKLAGGLQLRIACPYGGYLFQDLDTDHVHHQYGHRRASPPRSPRRRIRWSCRPVNILSWIM